VLSDVEAFWFTGDFIVKEPWRSLCIYLDFAGLLRLSFGQMTGECGYHIAEPLVSERVRGKNHEFAVNGFRKSNFRYVGSRTVFS